MTELPDLSQLTHEEKDALIRALWAQVGVDPTVMLVAKSAAGLLLAF